MRISANVMARSGNVTFEIALDFAESPHFADSDRLAKLYTDGWRLDYRATVAGHTRPATVS